MAEPPLTTVEPQLDVVIKQASASLSPKVKRQFCCRRSRVEFLCCPSKCARQQLIKNARAITPAESGWRNGTELSLASNLSILHVNRRARGRAADEADAESFSYTGTTNALLCLTVSHEVQLLPPPSPFVEHVTRSLTSSTTHAVSCPDPTPRLPFLISAIFSLNRAK